MAVMKSVQIMSESPKSFEAAIENAVKRTGRSVKGIRSANVQNQSCLLYTSPSPRDRQKSRMPSSA